MNKKNVTELDKHRPHYSGLAKCTNCDHSWVAVAPTKDDLECPSCGHLTGKYDHPEEILDALENMWWQFGYECGPVDAGGMPQWRNSGGLSALEEAEGVLLQHGRIEKYRKNGKMEWYKLMRG